LRHQQESEVIRYLTMAALVAATPVAVSAQAVTPQTYIMKAGASDLYEKQSSQLLLTSTDNAKLKDFATMMIQDHTKSTNDVKMAAKQANLTVAPPKLDAMQSRNMAALRAAKGTARDTLYIKQQKASHQMALQLQQGYATNGSVEPLKTVAAGIVPVVQTHISELNAM
jgi:putative membrane protein